MIEAITSRVRIDGRWRWRSIAVGAAAALAIGEAANAFLIETPAAALVFAALFAGALAWIRRGGKGGLILLGALCAVELLFLPSYDRSSAIDWINQAYFATFSLLSLTAVTAEIRANRSGRSPASATAL